MDLWAGWRSQSGRVLLALGMILSVATLPGRADRHRAHNQTLEDIYGDTGNTFQGGIGFLTLQADSPHNLPDEGFGLAIDDMVVEWREYRLDEDSTHCALGQCAVLDLDVSSLFRGQASLDVTLAESSPHAAHCIGDGQCSLSGAVCADSSACAPEDGSCENLVCFSAADCPLTTCQSTTNDCDGNGGYFDPGDDADCDNDGILDLPVQLSSNGEPSGERLHLNFDASSGLYRGSIPVSSRYDAQGVLFVRTQGTQTETIDVRYDDRDDGTGAAVCANAVDPASRGIVRVAADVTLSTGNVTVMNYQLDDNGDQDSSADDEETVGMRIELENKSGVPLTGVVARLSTNDPKIDCIPDGEIRFDSLGVDESRLSDEGFIFVVGQANRTHASDPIAADFTVTVAADQFDQTATAQVLALDLDLDYIGGAGPTTFTESFESGDFGQFTTMHLDLLRGDGGNPSNGPQALAASDGFRCQ